jgi:uncharacterized membrane-anchored protein/ABC-type multidrug transport system permease subunit
MQTRNLPALDTRYWIAILFASLVGTTSGDVLSHTLKMGLAVALPPLAGLFALVLFIERRSSRAGMVHYWVAVVITAAAATNLGDSLIQGGKLGLGRSTALVTAAFALYFAVFRARGMFATRETLPSTNSHYWMLFLLAGMLGTTLGDFIAGGLKVGPGLASFALAAALGLIWRVNGRAARSSDARYWTAIIVTQTAATTIGDLLAQEDGLHLGFGPAAVVVALLLLLVLRYRGDRAVDLSRYPRVSALWGMAQNDLAVWLRSPTAIAAALLPALGMGVLVAMLTVSVGQQPVALVVEGQGKHAARMARIIKGDEDAYLLEQMSAAEAERAFGQQRVAAMIVVPENFDWAAYRSKAVVDLYLNNINIDIADDLRRSVSRSVAEFDAPQLGLLGELHGPSVGVLLPNPYRVAVAEHDLRQTEVSFLQYQVIPIIVLIVISVGMLGTALLTARDFERGTAKLLVLSPAGRAALILGRLLGGGVITVVLVAPLVLLGFMTHSIPFCEEGQGLPQWVIILLSGACGWILPPVGWTHAAALVALLAAVTVTTVGLGTLLGVALRDLRLVTMTALNGSAYLFFLGGGFTTVAFLPYWVQAASRFVPTKYAIEGLRQALFYPDLRGFGHDLSVLIGCAVLSTVLASAVLARTWRRA